MCGRFGSRSVHSPQFHNRWNLSRQPTRRPRILFPADRNILANQASNAVSAFPKDALVRVDPADIRKKGKVPKNAHLFVAVFQTFMSGPPIDGKPSPYFGEYPPDFDFIIVDERHRGGANDESTWREIPTYFKPALRPSNARFHTRTATLYTHFALGCWVLGVGCWGGTPPLPTADC